MSDVPYLSIVIPAHNEENRLPGTFEKIDAFLQTKDYRAEVVVVENGSHDNTVGVVQAFAQDHPYVRLFVEQARGKGLAIKRGMLEARGEYRFMCDADLSMPIEELDKFLPGGMDGYDICIGSREAPGAVRYNEPWHRHFMGRVNTWIIKLTVLRDFEDTQCGFKMWRADVAEDLFSVSRMGGIGFDVETLFVAKKRGYRINEIGIDWYFASESRMRLVGDSLAMLREIFEVRRNWQQGLYARQAAGGNPQA